MAQPTSAGDGAGQTPLTSSDSASATAHYPLGSRSTAAGAIDDSSTYVVPSTGAILSTAKALPLLNEFCQLLHRPDSGLPLEGLTSSFVGGGTVWQCEMRLPMIAAFGERRAFTSPILTSKKAAQRACAFEAAVELHKAGALDENLQPSHRPAKKGAARKDVDGRKMDPGDLAQTLVLDLFNPFGDLSRPESRVYLHVVELVEDGQPTRLVGLVAGASLAAFGAGELFPSVGRAMEVRVVDSKELELSAEDRKCRLDQLQELNKMSTGVVLNKRLLGETSPTHFALWGPLDHAGDVDWNLVAHPLEPMSASLSNVKEGELVIVAHPLPNERLLRLIAVREDVNSLSPTVDVYSHDPKTLKKRRKLIEKAITYNHYISVMYSLEMSREVAEPLVQAQSIQPSIVNMLVPQQEAMRFSKSVKVYPASMCSTSYLAEWWWDFVQLVPSLERLIHDRLSVLDSIARLGVGEPGQMRIDLATVAFTPPVSQTGYSYETLECVGDSILKVCTSVHAYLIHPKMDEGLLSTTRQNSLDNRFLRLRSIDSGFASALLPAPFRLFNWVPIGSEDDTGLPQAGGALVKRSVHRKMTGDLLEATLGAAWLSAGVPLVLVSGEQMGLCFGGTLAWAHRPGYLQLMTSYDVSPPPASLAPLEASLGYKFRRGRLLVEAVTHRSYLLPSGYSYERLEFLGDSILDAWAIDRLFNKFPTISEGNLTFVRALLVSSPTLSLIAIRTLTMQRHLLHSAPLLDGMMQLAVDQSVKYAWSGVGAGDLVWSFSPVKALGDAVEACLGAIFLDCECNLEAVFGVLDKLYEPVMPYIVEAESRDWVTKLLQLQQKLQCRHLTTDVSQRQVGSSFVYTATVKWHGTEVGSATQLASSVARQLASRLALLEISRAAQDARDEEREACGCLLVFKSETEERKRAHRELKEREMGPQVVV